jgi:hypothetical protein
MKVTLESTDKILRLVVDGHEVPARLWEGATEGGVAVVAFITRISPQTHDEATNATFARELIETCKPKLEGPWDRPIDLRYIL